MYRVCLNTAYFVVIEKLLLKICIKNDFIDQIVYSIQNNSKFDIYLY